MRDQAKNLPPAQWWSIYGKNLPALLRHYKGEKGAEYLKGQQKEVKSDLLAGRELTKKALQNRSAAQDMSKAKPASLDARPLNKPTKAAKK